jgi:dolichol-phosphate mannosyltransferase
MRTQNLSREAGEKAATESSPVPSVALLPNAARVAVIIPTYREAENIPGMIERLAAVREASQLDLEVLFVDDNSQDGSEEIVSSKNLPWVRIIVRTKDRGLSQAVLEGLRTATSDYLVVMDADLSHPPEKIPELVRLLSGGMEFVAGSRFTEGGSTDDDWGVFRWLNSRVATLLALPLTRLKDPMSGFFALHRDTFLRGNSSYNPIGYKIGLELVVKCNCTRVAEVPIHFVDRRLGSSKLSFKEQLRYLQHIRRLYIHRFGTLTHLAQFAVVGFSGALLNIALLTLGLEFGLRRELAVGVAIAISMVWNFILNRRFSFSYARNGSIVAQFFGFVSACSVGALINYWVTLSVWHRLPNGQVAALVGILAGLAFNFLMNRFFVFRRRHVRVAAGETKPALPEQSKRT